MMMTMITAIMITSHAVHTFGLHRHFAQLSLYKKWHDEDSKRNFWTTLIHTHPKMWLRYHWHRQSHLAVMLEVNCQRSASEGCKLHPALTPVSSTTTFRVCYCFIQTSVCNLGISNPVIPAIFANPKSQDWQHTTLSVHCNLCFYSHSHSLNSQYFPYGRPTTSLCMK